VRPRLHCRMNLAGSSYPVVRSTGVCSSTGRAFGLGEAFVATLVEREGQPALERQDFSIGAWEAGDRPGAPLRLFGFWRATYHPQESRKQPLLGDDELLDLFEELGAATEARQITFRYLLALLLIRRRVLKVVGTRRDAGVSTMLVLPKGRAQANPQEEPVAVTDPGLDDQAVSDAMEQLGQVVATDALNPQDPQSASPQ